MIGRRAQAAMKRIADVAVASAGLLLMLPILAGAATAIAVSMGRPVLFRQPRPGRNGRIFTLYKLRTMRHPRPGENWFRSDADRLTVVGRFMRKTSLDELPSLWNVLKGDMSLVGPRPLLVEYLPKYTPEENRRHEVRPGITGLAQISGRQHLPFSKRLALDVWYVDHQSSWLDLKILVTTAIQAIRPTGVLSGQDVDEVDDIGLSSDRERKSQT